MSLGLLYVLFGDLSDAFWYETICTLVFPVPLIIVLDGPARVGIAPDLSGLPGPLHLLDKVLAIGRRCHGHQRRVRKVGATAKGAGEGRGRGEGAGEAWLAQGVVTAKERDWLLGRDVEVLLANLAHHIFIFPSSSIK